MRERLVRTRSSCRIVPSYKDHSPPFSRISVSIFFPPSPFPPFPPAQPRGRRFVGGIENESSFGYPFSFSPYKHWRRKKGRGDSRKQPPRPDTKTSISSSTSSVAGAGSFSSLPWLHIRFVSPRAQAKLLSHIRTEGERKEPDEVVLSDDESVFWCCCFFCWLTGPRLIFLNKPTTPPPAHSFPPLTNAWKKYLHLIPRRLPERPHLDFYFFSPFVWEFVESGIGFRFSGVPSITSIEVRSIFTPISYFEAAWRKKKSNIIGAGGGHFRILFYFSSSLSRLTLGGKQSN